MRFNGICTMWWICKRLDKNSPRAKSTHKWMDALIDYYRTEVHCYIAVWIVLPL